MRQIRSWPSAGSVAAHGLRLLPGLLGVPALADPASIAPDATGADAATAPFSVPLLLGVLAPFLLFGAGVFWLFMRRGKRRRYHQSQWRGIVAHAPLVGAAALACGAVTEDMDMLLSPRAYWVLGPFSLAAGLVSWQVVRAMSRRITPVAQAQAGNVALRGQAQPLSGRAPLQSPTGKACLWYQYRHTTGFGRNRSTSGWDSVEPFLLVDDSGACIVLPEGAEVDGGHHNTDVADVREHVLLPGDAIYVAGCFKPPSEETRQLLRQTDAAAKPPPVVVLRDVAPGSAVGETLRRGGQLLRQAQMQQAASAAATPPAPDLPVVGAPRLGPYYIVAKEGRDEAGWYRGVLWINLALLLLSAAMASRGV